MALFIDFADPKNPMVEKLDFDFEKAGHALCIIDCGTDHANLTGEYAAIPSELKALCALFVKDSCHVLSVRSTGGIRVR